MSQYTTQSATATDSDATDRLVHAVTSAVADAEGVDPWDLRPLYDVVDPEALESLVGESSTDRVLEVTFAYHGYEVTVDAEGDVSVQE